MSYLLACVDRVVLVRWLSGGPSPVHLDEIATLVLERRRTLKHPIVYLAVVDPAADLPSADERAALDAFSRRLFGHVSQSLVVIEGDGFKNAIQRSVIAALGRYWWRGDVGPVTVHKTVREAIDHMIGVDPALHGPSITAEAQLRGIIR